jgi:predicted permease
MLEGAFSLVIVMLALGVALRLLDVLPKDASETLNLVVLYVCLPATVLLNAPKLVLDASVVKVALVPWLLLGVSVLSVNVASRIFRFRRDEHAVLLLCTSLGNTSFLGYPLVVAFLGQEALPYAVIYDQFGVFLILSTFGLFVLSRYGGDTKPTPALIAKRIGRFPPFWALLFGLTLMPKEPPHIVHELLDRVAQTLLPLAMLAIGLGIRFRLAKNELKPLGIGLFIKLVVLPACALGLVHGLGHRALAAEASVLEAAMPPMITAGALAMSHRLAPRLAAALIGYGILLSLVTVPLWVHLLTSSF